jgi:methylated-DNA-[protein]-cysteine S-methyltransferase
MHAVVQSQIGELLLVGDGTSLTGLYTAEHVRRPTALGDRDDLAFEQARRELSEYFDGSRTEFEIELSPAGTVFQQQVWNELRRIGFGQTATYREVAERIGRPTAVRAVGMANGRNPISIVVPCHRVLGTDGTLTGYAGGLEAKRWLLAHEGHTPGTARGSIPAATGAAVTSR